jgi:biopolymer transport protein ExbD
MGVSVQATEGGGRKSVDTEINLVPFIDMMSVMVAFLLITAVWTNLSRIDVKNLRGEKGDEAPTDKVATSILVAQDSIWVGRGEAAAVRIEGRDPAALWAALNELPQNGLPVEVAAEDRVPYQDVVSTMDAALAAGYPSITFVEPRQLTKPFKR